MVKVDYKITLNGEVIYSGETYNYKKVKYANESIERWMRGIVGEGVLTKVKKRNRNKEQEYTFVDSRKNVTTYSFVISK